MSRLAVVVSFVLAASATAAWDLAEVLDKGLAKGRVPRRLRSELRAAKSLFGKTGARFRPKLSAILSEGGRKELRATQRLADSTRATVSAVDPVRGGGEYSFELFLPVFQTQALQQKTAEYNWLATRARNTQSLEDYKLDVINRFYALLRAQNVVTIRKRQVERWDGNLALAEFRAEIGVRSKLDFWNTKVSRANSVNDLIRAEVSAKQASDRLANLLGFEFDAMDTVEEDLRFELFAQPEATDWVRDDYQARAYQARLAGESLRAAYRTHRPDLGLTLGSNKVEGRKRDDSASLRYNFQFGRREETFDLRVAKEADVQASIALESLGADIEQEQRQVDRDLEAARKSIEVAEEALELAKLSYEASRLQFESGSINQIELQRTQDNLTNAEQTLNGFLIDYRIAAFRWVRAFGGDLEP